ncbi:hypothetical protein [uncultured Psychrobacter sp.]|uniref:hypothetical protein n=1 Tax=uncultured Psychrobacter sp. TaxID=259303 RepID=UPI002592D5DD|nr:hypothetical protein [uncultured Psychrobacter sp.]
MIDEISSLPIDLHVAGHTHGGQIFPLTLLVRGLAPLHYGAKVVGETQFLVTSGYGFGRYRFDWGRALRFG